MSLDDKVGVAFMICVWQRLVDEVSALMVHNVDEFIVFGFSHGFFLFGTYVFGNRKGVHFSSLFAQHIVLVEFADNVWDGQVKRS